jgi:dolichyl-phosphate beta-glucosyltransferase
MTVAPFLSLVVPAFNEAIRFQKTLPVLREFLKRQNYSWELLIVDDGSSDGTADVPGKYFNDSECRVIRLQSNRGKGYAVRKGVASAQGQRVLISDADLSTPLKEINKLFDALEQGADIAIGSRSLAESNVVVRQKWYRQGMGRFFHTLVQFLTVKGLIDTQCGFKCFEREKFQTVFSKMTIERFSFDVELLFIAQKYGMTIREIPVEWHHVEASRVRIWIDPVYMFLGLLKIRLNDWRGLYNETSDSKRSQ